MARVILLGGPVRSGRERAMDELTVEYWDKSLLVVPSRYEAGERSARIVQSFRLAGAWGPRVVSFEDLALGLLRDRGIFPYEIDEAERRALISGVLHGLGAAGMLQDLGDAANSAGLANHALRVITKLKQAAIEPRQFRDAIARRKRSSWLDPIVADAYEAYQAALQQCDAYDRVGIYWHASAHATRSHRFFEQYRHVLFDSFEDFTPSELRLIRQLAVYAETLAVGLVCDTESASRKDLYSIPLATLQTLRKWFPEIEVRSFPEPVPNTRSEYIASNLFWRDKPQSTRGVRKNVTLMACHDRTHECEWIGRTIKALLVEQNVAVGKIAIVFRRIDAVAPRLRLICGEYQIPAAFHVPRTVLDSAFARHLLHLLEVPAGWERDAVLDVLTSRWLGTPCPYAGAFGYFARLASVIKGKSEWFSQTQRLDAWLADGAGDRHDDIFRRVPGARAVIAALRERLECLKEHLRLLPGEATRAGHCEALLKLIEALQPERTVEEIPDESGRKFEEQSIHAIAPILRRMRAWDGALNATAKITLASFQMELRNVFAAATVEDGSTAPGIQIMSAETARYRDYDYLFLGGMNEGEFPAPPPADAIYSEEDWHDLENAGAPAEKRSTQMDREMLLFHRVLTRVQIHAYVSWSLANHDGRPLAQSPFIAVMKELLPGEDTGASTAHSLFPTLETAASPRDLRNVIVAGAEVETRFAGFFACMRAGLEAETARNSREKLGVYDGIIADAELLASLSDMYGPAHVFSAAQLESYAQCPFQFFLQRILRIDVAETPDEEFDPRMRGQILHEILQHFHQSYRDTRIGAIPEVEANDRMMAFCDQVFDRHAARDVTSPPGVVQIERTRMKARLARYLEFARAEELPWAPSNFEVGFGLARATTGDPLTRPEPFSLDTEIGPILLSGRIDRVDKNDGDARIIDYKTTARNAPKDIVEGISLQLPLYAVALEQFLMEGVNCAEARLLQPGRKDSIEVLKKTSGDKWPQREAGMRSGIARAVAGIRNGQFPPTPHGERCAICVSCRVCRHEQWRIDRKTQDDAAANT